MKYKAIILVIVIVVAVLTTLALFINAIYIKRMILLKVQKKSLI